MPLAEFDANAKLAKYNVSILQEDNFHDDDRNTTRGHRALFFFNSCFARGMKGVADGRGAHALFVGATKPPLHHLFKANVLFKISVYAL
jgi:hypothetical protein